MSYTATLRTLIQSPDLLVMPGIFDGFSARLVEHSGFAAGFISGAGLSETLLGYSDVGLMGFELNLAAVTRLAACCSLPVLADADTGYGNAVNVYHRRAPLAERRPPRMDAADSTRCDVCMPSLHSWSERKNFDVMP